MANNNDDEDLFSLIWIALGSIGAIIAFATAMVARAWNESIDWLLEHSILVAGTQTPLLTVPHAGGAGLDVPRCFIAASVLLLLAFAAVQGIRRHWARARDLS